MRAVLRLSRPSGLSRADSARRTGTTLVEVLMSLMIMAIGVVTVATLFPISVLRSVHATQLTQATVLRYNAEALIDLHYNLDSLLNADPTRKNLVFDPDDDQNYAEHFDTNYLIDPLGAQIIGGAVGSLPRFQFTATNEQTAANLCTLPDSWVLQYETSPLSTAGTWDSVTFDTQDKNIELDVVYDLVDAGNTVHIHLYDVNGRMSATRDLTDSSQIDTAGLTISWTDPLPDNGLFDEVSRVRIETAERRYSWLLTVRNTSKLSPPNPQASVDVVVFFRRGYGAEDETIYSMTQTGSSNKYDVDWSGGSKPFLKRGGWLLDTDNGRWYRIQEISENSSSARLTLEGNAPPVKIQNACFMRGIVDVYPIGSKP